jgi:hypothetical protein
MKKKLAENIKLILSVLALFGVFSGGAGYVWSMEGKVDKNTQYRLEEQYDRTWERIERIKERCASWALRSGETTLAVMPDSPMEFCSDGDKKDFRRWSIKMDELKKELGY